MEAFEIEAHGLLGLLIELGQNFRPSTRSASVLGILQTLISQAEYMGTAKAYVGLASMSAVLIFSVIIVPPLIIVTLLYLWLVPLSKKTRNRVVVAIEVLSAWQYLEVFLLSILVGSWQTAGMSKLFLNRYCKLLDFAFSQGVYYGLLSERDGQCFEMSGTIGLGSFMIIPVGFGVAVMSSFVMSAVIQSFREEDEEEMNALATEGEKLRALDRTTWDDTSEAMKALQDVPVLFTDAFGCVLRSETSMDDQEPPREVGSAVKGEASANAEGQETSSSGTDSNTRAAGNTEPQTEVSTTKDNKK